MAAHVYRIDVASGEKTLISEVAPAIDNLALDADDNLYITNMADSAIIAIDTETGEARTIVSGALASPAISDVGYRHFTSPIYLLRAWSTRPRAM